MAESTAIERLQMSVVDGRTESGRYRQYQLQALHESLREQAGNICSALLADSKSPSAEVETEYYLAMNAVRHFYDSLDFEGELKEEYSVVHGKDNLSRRVGVGLVVIRPTSHTRFYSIVTPLAAAIAAGNCVILELPDNVRRVDVVLRAHLTEALDGDTFHVSKSVTDRSILEDAVVVDQNSTVTSRISSPSHLTSPTNARCVAVVDRSANVDEAAKAITVARFSFGGQSPYAPDLVLVNEFVKTNFFEACSRYATLAFAKESSVKNVSVGENDDVQKVIKDAESKKHVSSFGSNDFKLVDILDKSSPIMNMKVTGRYLPIATCSSLTDAIYNYDFEKPLLAGYFFAEPGSAKYLAQFIPSHMSLINQIPVHLLVGPAAPTAHEPDFHYRYSRDMFSVPRPQFVEKPPDVLRKVEELLSGTSKEVTASTLREAAAKPLPPTKQSDNKAVGFFEQGLFTGAGIVASIIIPAVGYSTYFLGRKGVEYVMRLRR
ncbi:Aldehyde dehydrogenase, dimeric NADP-preferring [Cytospora mali]|uniref:Aldehyde dehydrogenase, dimeric NADP-preferring n=1 Tax=Cytospora mali TaxID=578113 RepID=A0A194UYS7_CYTMA|nr:Aldehyde dehydrogenase, dimeric NADP-preferring [Valsa mali var. pyri (nom. inval.)]